MEGQGLDSALATLRQEAQSKFTEAHWLVLGRLSCLPEWVGTRELRELLYEQLSSTSHLSLLALLERFDYPATPGSALHFCLVRDSHVAWLSIALAACSV